MDERILYHFTVNEDTGEIQRFDVKEYHTSSIAYVWKKSNGYTKYSYKRNIDKLCHGEICSFNESYQHARELFLDYYEEKAKIERKKLALNENLIKKIKLYYSI